MQKMNEFQAAMGLCNLRHVDREIERYIENFNGIDGIRLPYIQKEVVSNYAYFPILFDSFNFSIDQVYHELMKQNIYTRKYFYPLTNQLECYQSKFTSNRTPVTQQISENILTLPLYADLHLADIDLICKIIKKNLVLN